ncbi:MAG TPA: hypothetical protein VIK04_06285 [Solirubrobacteraceae bacterium]
MRAGSDPPLSILFDREPVDGVAGDPQCFADLHLDEIVRAATSSRSEHELAALFQRQLPDVDAVAYRHEVLRDLSADPGRAVVQRFSERMGVTRRNLAAAESLRYGREKERWFVEAARVYCDAANVLATALTAIDLGSEGLRRVRDYVADYVASEPFQTLRRDAERLAGRLAAIRYLLELKGLQVRVLSYEERPEISSEVAATFSKFAQGAVRSYRREFKDWGGANHVDARIMEGVAGLYPEVFGEQEAFCKQHADFPDAIVLRLDLELQFYLSYLELIEPLQAAGLRFALPAVSGETKELDAAGVFDLALALKLVPRNKKVVCNDVSMDGPERAIVVTGPNSGGKTTLARAFGQLHYLAALGLPVPASSARLFLADHVFTHFEREEDIATLRGNFEDELFRIHGVLEQATADSVIVINEAFGSTTSHDAALVGTAVLERILKLDALCIFVTFVDDLAALGESVVSMMSLVDPCDPAIRTYRVVRKPTDGLAYAAAIAAKHRLSYETLKERLGQ